MKLSTVVLPLIAGSCVTAHGILRRITIQETTFEGNRVGSGGAPSVIRQVSAQDPNYGVTNPAITCGRDAVPAAKFADANPGDTIKFEWREANDGLWPHNTGPMLTYMASCGSGTCDQFNHADAQWFKIDQVGKKPNSNAWVQADLMTGAAASVKIPENLRKGDYLIRHEIIALHIAESAGPEFYAGCAQLRLSGSGNGFPKTSDLVKLPGAYRDDDPGLRRQNYFEPGLQYSFPGPNVATLEAGTPPTPADPTAGSPASSPSPSPLKKTCKKRPTTSPSEPVTIVAARAVFEAGDVDRARRISHLMRRVTGLHR